MRILIAVPTFETIFPDTYKSIWDINKGGHEVAFEFVRGYDCATARNNIAQIAIDGNFDYVLMVDNDVVLPRDVLMDMLDDPELLSRAGKRARETIPVPWETIMETAVERYTRLVALGKEGKLKDKRIRIV